VLRQEEMKVTKTEKRRRGRGVKECWKGWIQAWYIWRIINVPPAQQLKQKTIAQNEKEKIMLDYFQPIMETLLCISQFIENVTSIFLCILWDGISLCISGYPQTWDPPFCLNCCWDYSCAHYTTSSAQHFIRKKTNTCFSYIELQLQKLVHDEQLFWAIPGKQLGISKCILVEKCFINPLTKSLLYCSCKCSWRLLKYF
jgi:hypothetical protein